MPGQNYYILAALTALGDLGATPPLAPSQLLEYLEDSPAPNDLAMAIFLSDDLLQQQALDSGEITTLEVSVLTEAQVRKDQPLPSYLVAPADQESPRAGVDELWGSYFSHAAQVARNRGSIFLSSWVAYEVALRNAFANARAKALELDPNDYLVKPELADPDADFTTLINEWSAAANPLAGLQVLDKTRWSWLMQNEGWFTFDNDEVAVYAAKLILLHRWHRLTHLEQNDTAEQNAVAPA